MKAKEIFLVSYLPTLKEVQEVLDNKASQIERYAYIMHDKDIYDKDILDRDTGEPIHAQGEIKADHIHIYIKLVNSRDIDEVKRWFVKKDENGKNINCLREVVRNRVSVIKYLIHDTKTSKHKHQYDINDVVSFNIENIEEDEPLDETHQIVLDIMSGMPKMELLKRYGKNFLYHYNVYKEFCEDIKKEYIFYADKTYEPIGDMRFISNIFDEVDEI